MRQIPQDNLAYPVLLEVGAGRGSGLYLATYHGIYLVTAAHVLFADNGNLLAPTAAALSYPRDPKERSRNLLRIQLSELAKSGELRRHSDRDIAVCRIGAVISPSQFHFSAHVIQEATTSVGIMTIARKWVKALDDALVGNDVYLFGYPVSLGIPASPQWDRSRPLVRKGIIAGIDEANRTMILDCPVYPGNSGGPVVEVDPGTDGTRFNVVGVVSEFVPAIQEWVNTTYENSMQEVGNSGYSVAISMDCVLELVDQLEQKP